LGLNGVRAEKFRAEKKERLPASPMTLERFLLSAGTNKVEGHSQQSIQETQVLRRLVGSPDVKHVMEIGFNAGHSAETFLSFNPEIDLTSFDIGSHAYTLLGKKYIDYVFPFRHRLFLGDSAKTLPEFVRENPEWKFDLIFIDGCHDYKTVCSDLLLSIQMSHPGTIVVMDDTMRNERWIKRWNLGPNRAWQEALGGDLILELGSEDFSPDYGMSWGKCAQG
jgi:predicted O-methyltransferase YrrM